MQDLIGKKVTVHSHLGGMEKQDVGILEAFDGTVLRLKKETEILYFVIYSVRLIKPF
jgi:hypothetical protein